MTKFLKSQEEQDRTLTKAKANNVFENILFQGEEYEMFFVDFGFTELLPKTRTKAIHPKFMETPFLANHVCLEGFEDMTKTKGKATI